MTTDPHTGILGSGAARALVLGSGGLTGIAWATGLLLGLERLGLRYSLSGPHRRDVRGLGRGRPAQWPDVLGRVVPSPARWPGR
jgi:hypothetical protein